MALAAFFNKTALAAADLLQGFSQADFAAALNKHTVGIHFDELAAETPEGITALELNVDLFARLYPRISLLPNGMNAGKVAARLSERAIAINPLIEVVQTQEGLSALVSLGATTAPAGIPVIYIGSQGWMVKVSSTDYVSCGESRNPFGAAAAACIGAANIFRLLFRDQLPAGSGHLDEACSFSLVDFQAEQIDGADSWFDQLDLGETSLVGNGAIGNAVIWTLARSPGLTGQLNVIDPEAGELSNVQRYVLMTAADVSQEKVMLARRALNQTNIMVNPFRMSWGAFLQQRNDWRLDRVLVAVDNAHDRRTIQGALPRWLANAWTQPGDLGVSRHGEFGTQACLTCLYFPEGQGDSEDKLVANAINLPAEFMAVRHLLYTGAPVGHELILRIAQANGVDPADLLEFENEPIRVFYSKAVCGGVLMRLGAGARPARGREVPMAFQSALAGVLLAAELVVHAGRRRFASVPTTTRINLLRPLPATFAVPVAQKSGCICNDRDYLSAHHAKWG